MKLVSYLQDEHDQLAILVDDLLFDMEIIHPDLPGNMQMFLHYWTDFLSFALAGEIAIKEGKITAEEFDAAVEATSVEPLREIFKQLAAARSASLP